MLGQLNYGIMVMELSGFTSARGGLKVKFKVTEGG